MPTYMPLPQNGYGYYTYPHSTAHGQYGTEDTIQAIMDIARH
jgi:hypothetical protein